MNLKKTPSNKQDVVHGSVLLDAQRTADLRACALWLVSLVDSDEVDEENHDISDTIFVQKGLKKTNSEIAQYLMEHKKTSIIDIVDFNAANGIHFR